MKKGDQIKYKKQFMFGKTGIVEATVVMTRNNEALLDNGDTVFFVDNLLVCK